MKKQEDPYSGILDVMQAEARRHGQQKGVGIGKIVSSPPDLHIQYNGMDLDTSRLWVDEYWVQGHERNTTGHLVSATQNRSGGSGDAAFASHNHDIDNDYTETLIMTDTWHVGDLVMLLPIYTELDMQSAQQFCVLGKLVRLDGGSV